MVEKQRETAADAEEKGGAGKGKYLYAVVPGSEKRRFGRIGINDSEVFTMPFRDVSAVVSNAPVMEYELTEENARRHVVVLRKLLDCTTVLPAEFGTVLGDEGVIRRLLERAYAQTKECIRHLDNLVELGLKVVLKKDAVIARRDELRSRCTEALEALRKISEQNVHGELFTDRLLLNESFLVRRERVGQFSDEVARLREGQPTMKFLYSGPWAPYNFVHLKIGRRGIEFRREGGSIGIPPR